MRSELKFSQTINHEVCFLHSGRGVPQSSGKLCAVSEDCGVLLRAAQEVMGPLILRTSGRATPRGVSPYALYHMESLIYKFTNKYFCFTVRGA